MKEDQYLFFCTILGNEDLLKEEISTFYPELTLSYSKKGFLTFKNKGVHYNLYSLKELHLTFCLRAGINLAKTDLEKLESTIEKIKNDFQLPSDNTFLQLHNFQKKGEPDLESKKLNFITQAPLDSYIINISYFSDNEIWLGIHYVSQSYYSYPNSNPCIVLPEDSPSRAYLKTAEAVKLFDLPLNKKDKWIDFGSAPGGASWYLLQNDLSVFGVDPAIMHKKVLDHPSFVHYKIPVQNLSQEKLPAEVKWVNVDLNLNPKQSIKEVLRLCKKYNQSLKGILFTIKLIKLEHVKNIEFYEDDFYDWGFTNILSCQLPSHKREYVIVALR